MTVRAAPPAGAPVLALALVLVLALAATAGAQPVPACPAWQAGALTIDRAWSRATVGAARPAVFYARITNRGTTDDQLTGIATAAAAMPMLHETVVRDGVASMPHVAALAVPAGGTVVLAPGGHHGMLAGLAAPLVAGDSFGLTLIFARAGPVTIAVEVAALTAAGPACDRSGT